MGLLSMLRSAWTRSGTRDQATREGFKILAACAALFVVGLIFVGWSARDARPTAVLYAFGFLLAGALIGFLFGIPKVYTHSSDSGTAGSAGAGAPASAAGAPGGAPGPLLTVNTNLEQISDWLTKIIVGIGLVQLANVPDYVERLTWFFAHHGMNTATASSQVPNAEGIVLGIALYFPALGFFAGYLMTRIILAAVFNAADQQLLPPQLRADVLSAPTLTFEEPQADVDPTAKAAAEKIAAVPLSQISSVQDLTAWSRAQLYLGNFERAAAGYLQATLADPNNPTYHQRYALALFNRKAPIEDVIAQLITAYALVTDGAGNVLPTADARVVGAIFENLTLTYLYVAPPDGFEIAIAYGTRALTTRAAKERVRYYLAAAYGQKYAWIKQNQANVPNAAAALAAAQSDVVANATAAITADPAPPAMKNLLQHLATGTDPKEDDLKVAYADTPALQTLLA